MIFYSTNWMGPANIDWFKSRGLTKRTTKTFKCGNGRRTIDYDEITENYSGGRIDIYGTSDPHNSEIGLPIMNSEDYDRFSNWLSSIRTESVLSLQQLVSMYEKDNPKIRWWKDNE